ncbi:MAG: RNA polymerase-binding protein DksA [SAR86 cluster bacterium]|jgi:DnaK suppressor protein|nr:RNA polymerase-binding protein DksA [SAR86 cluster bacterium]
MPAKKTSKTASKRTANTKKVAQKKVTTKKTTLNKSKSKTPVKKTAKAKSPQKKASPRKLKASVNYEESQFLASIKPYALKKNEKYMNAKQKQHFQDILESWRHQLQIEQDRTADKIQKNVSHFPDESDRATHEEEFTLELRTRERERRLLSKIKESVEDLKADDYGFCASCGIEIGIRRLEARPTATRCIDCKTIEEIHERQQYG